jgi:hypothetical protein
MSSMGGKGDLPSVTIQEVGLSQDCAAIATMTAAL